MRSFAGISNHGPYVGIGFSRHHGRRKSSHYARRTLTAAEATAIAQLLPKTEAQEAAEATLIQANENLRLANNALVVLANETADRNARALDRELSARLATPYNADADLAALRAEMAA